MNDEIKVWNTHSIMHKVAMLLIMDGISFSYKEDDGIVFSAPEWYVERMKERLVTCYRCSLKPIINEVK